MARFPKSHANILIELTETIDDIKKLGDGKNPKKSLHMFMRFDINSLKH